MSARIPEETNRFIVYTLDSCAAAATANADPFVNPLGKFLCLFDLSGEVRSDTHTTKIMLTLTHIRTLFMHLCISSWVQPDVPGHRVSYSSCCQLCCILDVLQFCMLQSPTYPLL